VETGVFVSKFLFQRRRTELLLSLFVGAAATAGVAQWRLDAANAAVAHAYLTRYEAVQAAGELQRTSDDLTRLARAYVMSGGDQKWREQYDAVLAAHAQHGARPHAQGLSDGSAALYPRARASTLTSDEVDTLGEAVEHESDAMRAEAIAMHLVEGLYDDGTGGFAAHGLPDTENARTMLFDADYHRLKAGVSGPIDEFVARVDKRTDATIAAANAAARAWTVVTAVGAVTGVMTLVFLLRRLLHRRTPRAALAASGHGDPRPTA
jgi:methyl-accepting chemotaxis protein